MSGLRGPNPRDAQNAVTTRERQSSEDAESKKANAALYHPGAVARWLGSQNPELGNTYVAAMRLLAETPELGSERTRVLLICHSMREVINRLPTAVMVERGGLDRSELAQQRGSSEQVRRLPALRSQYPDLDLSLDAENIPVPRDVARAFNNLIDAAVFEDQRRLSDLAAFLTDDANPRHPAVREWRALSAYFTRWAHLGVNSNEPVPSDLELSDKVQVFEDHVDAIRLAFFDSKNVIDDLLAAANRPVEEDEL